METHALTPTDLFPARTLYEIPTFQRPYVWNEEDQWQPLWDDIEALANEAVASPDRRPSGRHFLGAIVLKWLPPVSGEPSRAYVIDGQQRLTTLQLLLDAAQVVMETHGHAEDAEAIQELVWNSSIRFAKTHKRFKLWPSNKDRIAFAHAMDNSLSVPDELSENRIIAAHNFYRRQIETWAVGGEELASADRLAALAAVLQLHLQVVTIDLDDTDDDQVIFETLNDRGTKLLQADLVKNFVFQRCAELGVDADAWADKYWAEFDDDWWRDEVAQGRLFRSRLDLFLQYWLTMRIADEVPADKVFDRFRTYGGPVLAAASTAEDFIVALRRDADTFRALTDLDPDSPEGRFYFRVVEALELGATIPLLLWLISGNHPVPPDQAQVALAHMESWVVRRSLLRDTMKDLNRLVIALIKEIAPTPPGEIGHAVAEFLVGQTAESRLWPTDETMRQHVPSIKLYGNVKQPRLRSVLGALEQQLRNERNEAVSLPARLEIEHVMPQAWRTYWGADVASDPERAAKRDALINTLGNLTLVTHKLNKTLSHRPWKDAAALQVAPTGPEAGKGKRSLLAKYSLLVLNKEIVDEHRDEWTDDDIAARGAELTEAAIQVWPRPAPSD